MVEPKRPILGYLLYKYFGIETKKYKQYWKDYCEYINYKLLLTKSSL